MPLENLIGIGIVIVLFYGLGRLWERREVGQPIEDLETEMQKLIRQRQEENRHIDRSW